MEDLRRRHLIIQQNVFSLSKRPTIGRKVRRVSLVVCAMVGTREEQPCYLCP